MTELNGYAQAEKRYLRGFECAWCNHSLAKAGCSACFEPCSQEVRDNRRKDCLAGKRRRGVITSGDQK